MILNDSEGAETAPEDRSDDGQSSYDEMGIIGGCWEHVCRWRPIKAVVSNVADYRRDDGRSFKVHIPRAVNDG